MTTISFTPSDRILILAPHPDDEVLSSGGVICEALRKGLPVKIVFLTSGDHNEWSFLVYRKFPVVRPSGVKAMGRLRQKEAFAAGKRLGLSPNDIIFLGYPDFGTLRIWTSHWGEGVKPYRSMFTRVNQVPYFTAHRPGASHKGESILRSINSVLLDFWPTKIFVSHPADHNADHQALYLFLRISLWSLKDIFIQRPLLYPYLIHFKKWPKPKGFQPNDSLVPPIFLTGKKIPWTSYILKNGDKEKKQLALKAHLTQFKYSSQYLLSFLRTNELFGDFTSVPVTFTPVNLSPEYSNGVSEEIPDQLTDEEKNEFIGIEERQIWLEGDVLVFSVKFTKPIGRLAGVSIFVLAYREDIPFAKMPKLRLKAGWRRKILFDTVRKVRIPKDLYSVQRSSQRVILKIPLLLLNYPHRVFTSVNSFFRNVPLDWLEWRIIDIPH